MESHPLTSRTSPTRAHTCTGVTEVASIPSQAHIEHTASTEEEEIEQDEHYSSEASSDCDDIPNQPAEPPQFVQLTTAPTVLPPAPVAAPVQQTDVDRARERLRDARARDVAASAPHTERFHRERASRASESVESADRQRQVARSPSHNEAARHPDGILLGATAKSQARHLHRTWSRDKSMSTESDHMKPPDQSIGHQADEYLLSPNMALQWQHLSLTQFKESVSHDLLSGLDRDAWTKFNQTSERRWNVADLEKKILATHTPFAKGLAEQLDELAEPVQPTVLNLPNILRDLSEDEHPLAVQVWLRLSRGVDVLPAEIRADMPHTDVTNYPVSDPLLQRQLPDEIQRHFDCGFCKTWSDIQKEFGVAEARPKNILPLNAVPKNESVCRVTFDPSNSNDENVPSVNEFADTLPKPTCIYPTFKHGTTAMYRQGWMVRADDSDAFLNHSLKPRSMSNCGFIDPRDGTVCALTKLGLGFQASAAIQQDTEVAQVRALRRRLRKLGLHTAGPDPDYQRKFPFVKPDTCRDSLTAALPYCDDIGAWLTTRVAAWFTCIHLLLQKKEWGVCLGMKPGKTDHPLSEMEWIGFLYKLRPMLVGFTPKKLTKMCDAVTPFSSAAAVTPTVKQAKSALGLLDHASNILLLGKAYFHVMRSQVTLLDSASKSRTAPDRTPFLLSTDLRHSMDMWHSFLTNMTARSAFIGVRRRVFPFPGYSDASFSHQAGWCWHCMGAISWGKWPSHWLNKLGPHSEFAEIFITECELWAILALARRMFPKARGMQFRGFADNLSTVHMLNKLSTRSPRCRLIVTEILWLAVVWDVEISYSHIPTDINVLSDFGTRQDDKAFKEHLKDFVKSFPSAKWRKAMDSFPARGPARPELLPHIPVAGAEEFFGMQIDPSAMGKLLPEWMSSGIINKDRRAALAAFDSPTHLPHTRLQPGS